MADQSSYFPSEPVDVSKYLICCCIEEWDWLWDWLGLIDC